MERVVDLLSVEALARKAMQAGQPLDKWPDFPDRIAAGRSGFRRGIGLTNPWDLAGKCERPITLELYGKSRHGDPREGERRPMTVRMNVKCRKCGWCRKTHAADWAVRALDEYSQAPRTWMGTLTLAPEQHARVDAYAIMGRKVTTRTGEQRYVVHPEPLFNGLLPEQQFARRVQVIGHDLTLFLKRVRKNAHAPFRHLLVAEAHKSGLPHFHMLIHEQSEDAPIRKHILKEGWELGFSKFALINSPGGAVYVCKYMAKDALTRVRASFQYGHKPYSLDYGRESVATSLKESQAKREKSDLRSKTHGGLGITPVREAGEREAHLASCDVTAK